MRYFAWILVGLSAGFFAGRLLDRSKLGILTDALLGMAGAVTGGWLYNTYGDIEASFVLSLNSLATAGLGAILLLLAHHAAASPAS